MDLENSNKSKNDESIKKVVVAEKDDHGAKKEEVKDESSDSEYETEEVYELREWYPPDFWRAKDQDSANRVCQTDVTANNLTVTMLESRVCDGFFKALWYFLFIFRFRFFLNFTNPAREFLFSPKQCM